MLLRPLSALALVAAAFAALSVAPVSASAQDTTKTITGHFKDSDGNKGKYVTTITTNGTTTTEQTIRTRRSDGDTSTDTSTRVENTDGTKTDTYSHNDFGTTAQYVSTKTVTPEKLNEEYATGTFTNAAGVSGTLTSLRSTIGNVDTLSTTRTSSQGTSTELRLKDSELGYTADKFITLNTDGTITTALDTHIIGHVEKN